MNNGWLRALTLCLLVVLSAPLLSLILFWIGAESTGELPSLTANMLFHYATGSFAVAGVGLVVSLWCGVLAAYLCARFDFPFRKVLLWGTVLPLAIPAYLVSYAWVDAFEDFGLRSSSLRNEGIAGLILGLSSMPYVFLPTYGALRLLPRAFLESGRLLGGRSWRRRSLTQLELPLVWPALFGGVVLAQMEIFADFGTVDFLAVDTWTTGIFRRWYAFGDPYGALRLALSLGLLSGALLWVEALIRKKAADFSGRSAGALGLLQGLGRVKGWGACALLSLPVLIAVVFPAAYLLWRMIAYEGPRAPVRGMWMAFGNTLALALGTGLLVIVMGLVTASVQRFRPSRVWVLIARAGTLGYALPGTIVALGILLLRADLSLSGLLVGVSLLVYAYCVRFAAIGSRVVEGSWSQIPLHYEEQSRVLGVGPVRTFARVSLPLLRTGLGCAAVLTALDVIKELPATMLLRPFDFETLSVHTYNLASDERLAEVAPTALLLMLSGALALFLAARLGAFEGVNRS